MTYISFLMLACFVMGVVGVASNPSPFYGAVGLLVGALGGSGVLISLGSSFVGLVLFLVYLGGILVVFAYSVALAAEPYPETWGDRSVFVCVLVILGFLVGGSFMFLESEGVGFFGLVGADSVGFFDGRCDVGGVVLLYSCGGLILLLCGWGLMLVLFVVLELVRGRARGSLRLP